MKNKLMNNWKILYRVTISEYKLMDKWLGESMMYIKGYNLFARWRGDWLLNNIVSKVLIKWTNELSELSSPE